VRQSPIVSVLVWPHGPCDPINEMRRLLRAAAMAPLSAGSIDKDDVPRLIVMEKHGQVLSATPFDVGKKRLDLTNPPAGFVAGVGGETQLVSECWQIEPWWSPYLDFLFGKPETWRTFLVARMVVRRYDVPAADSGNVQSSLGETAVLVDQGSLPQKRAGIQTSYWETEATFYVDGLRSVSGTGRLYPTNIAHQYLRRAENVARELNDYLNLHPAPSVAIKWRANLPSQRTAP
jgi:hypothetical protein